MEGANACRSRHGQFQPHQHIVILPRQVKASGQLPSWVGSFGKRIFYGKCCVMDTRERNEGVGLVEPHRACARDSIQTRGLANEVNEGKHSRMS